MIPDAGCQAVPVQCAVPHQVLRGTTDEKGDVPVTSENGSMTIGIRGCGAHAEDPAHE